MNKKDILELKRRLKKDDCSFTRMCGCYVDSEKNIVLNIDENFLNLKEEEFFKYLEIAKKTLSGTIGNNLLELNFTNEGENINQTQLSLLELKNSKLKDKTLLDNFYKNIIDNYDFTGNYLILLFHDAYDVITKTSDNLKIDESEEVYDYILCSICPVLLTKPGLRYFQDNNKIGVRIRDWVVELPSNGFLFPAFTDRSTDINSIMYYTKNAKDSHPELMESGLGCAFKQTATEQKEIFTNIVSKALGNDEDKSKNLFMEIQENLNTMVDDHITVNGKESEPIILNTNNIQELLIESGVSEEITNKIEKSYIEEFGDNPPLVDHLIDNKILKANEQRKKEQRLEKEIERLQNKLEFIEEKEVQNKDIDQSPTETSEVSESDLEIATDSESDIRTNNDYDVILNVKPEKLAKIKTEIINGVKCIIIPTDDNEQIQVNGVSSSN